LNSNFQSNQEKTNAPQNGKTQRLRLSTRDKKKESLPSRPIHENQDSIQKQDPEEALS
jgi:hypothetical protein